ncbi:response regulator (plasmid) [Deinococcus aetherius]|uniref:Response regulator n=1 Tax=Deinococcus aetherius TaxID=200252 RepID=A0ABM8AJW5_9DEIO|nr:response regulator [Deinococcus aetherius]BDP44116.1 response regulator [Deinococcus aetherius]
MVLKRDSTGPRPEAARSAVRRVLVIEDSAQDALLLELAFEELAPSVQVHLAHDGEEALHALGTLPAPDFVLLDLHLPGRDGLELLGLVRDRVGEGVRVVCWSSRAQPREVEATSALGAAYVEKPLGHDDLLVLVESWLGG